MSRIYPWAPEAKVFWFFSSEKNILAFMTALRAPVAPRLSRGVRVMICDDSVVIRSAIANMLSGQPGIEVVAKVANGRAAVDALKVHEIDVVVLDIEMPVMDGLTALPLLLAASPKLSVIMASTLTTRGAEVTMKALRLGAADFLPKPSASGVVGDQRFAQELVAKVRGLARLRGAAVPAPPSATATATALRPPPREKPLLLAIGSSTGGPNALFALVQSLSPKLPVPVVLTQHMPPAFTPILAQHIDKLGVLPCTEAKEGDALVPGKILLAPGDRHLLVRRQGARLVAHISDTPPENFCRPAVDPMLRSACEAMGGRVLVAMLTGMGHDGLEGTRRIIEAGGALVAQDEASSVVWGMPGAVVRAGLAHAVLPLPQIGAKLMALLGMGPGVPRA
jgi:two-component system chemotaxis response regulator CheB